MPEIVLRSPHGATFRQEIETAGFDLLARHLPGFNGTIECARLGVGPDGLIFDTGCGLLAICTPTWRTLCARLGDSAPTIWASSRRGESALVRMYAIGANPARARGQRGPGRRSADDREALAEAMILHGFYSRSQRQAVDQALESFEIRTQSEMPIEAESRLRKALEREIGRLRSII